MNEHDQALLDLYDLMMARKIVRLHLRSKFSTAINIVKSLHKMSPEEMLDWAKKSNEELDRRING